LIEGILLQATAKIETGGVPQGIVQENQIRLDLAAANDRGLGILGRNDIAIVISQERF
jgi:hypothetical protein